MTFAPALRRAIRSARARASGSELVSVRCEADVDIDGAIDQRPKDGHAFVWDTRGSESLEDELTIGLGTAAVIEADGRERFDSVRRRADALLATIVGRDGAAGLRLFGGFAFDEAPSKSWSGFGAARFVLPRVTLTRRGDAPTQIALVVPSSELFDEGKLVEEVGAVVDAPLVSTRPVAGSARITSDGSQTFVDAVTASLSAIGNGAVEKVVMARATSVEHRTTPECVLRGLSGATGCVRFGILAGSDAFVGATPELLVARDARGARTEALAGSEPRRGFDLFEASRLLVREKDLREHRLVVEAIRAHIEPLSTEVTCPSEPRLRTLAHVHHLVTPIVARVKDGVHVLELARALHPTPALGGVPREAALALMRAYEGFERGGYAGPVGWFDARGEGAFVVGIRSAKLERRKATVYAGAGIVAGSVPSLELAETTAKLATMLRALGCELGATAQETTAP
jgi:menaquinone-specific isochorismate synthase